jgi:hypothetical protein
MSVETAVVGDDDDEEVDVVSSEASALFVMEEEEEESEEMLRSVNSVWVLGRGLSHRPNKFVAADLAVRRSAQERL